MSPAIAADVGELGEGGAEVGQNVAEEDVAVGKDVAVETAEADVAVGVVKCPEQDVAVGVVKCAEGASVPSSKRAKTTPDAMTRAWFAETATSVELVVGGHKAELPVKAFRTGSSGWFVNTKLPFTVGSEEVRVSVQCCCIVVDSKRWSDA